MMMMMDAIFFCFCFFSRSFRPCSHLCFFQDEVLELFLNILFFLYLFSMARLTLVAMAVEQVNCGCSCSGLIMVDVDMALSIVEISGTVLTILELSAYTSLLHTNMATTTTSTLSLLETPLLTPGHFHTGLLTQLDDCPKTSSLYSCIRLTVDCAELYP